MSINRWKLASILFATTTAVAGFTAYKRGASHNVPAAKVSVSRSGNFAEQLRRPVHVNAAALGVSEQELIDRARAARSTRELSQILGRLGMVGSDDAVIALKDLVTDPRRGVPEEVVAMMGKIATEHAVEELLGLLKDERPNVRSAAISGLGATHSEKAESALFEIAQKPGDPMSDVSIRAIGELGSDNAVALLIKLANGPLYESASQAVWSLGGMQSPMSRTALAKLIDANDPRIAETAMRALDEIDDELAKRLVAIAEEGNWQTSSAAISALGRASADIALPPLSKLARTGSENLRYTAIYAIGEIGGDARLVGVDHA